MKPKTRTIAAVGLLLVGAALSYFLAFEKDENGPVKPAWWQSSAQCAECHGTIYREWKESLHARAWTDPSVRALSDNFANTDCIACHASRPVFETGPGNRVLPRIARREEGVDCIACHAAGEGVAGSKEGASAACKPRRDATLSQPIFCAGCHNQHGTVDQWQKTSFAAQGVTCVSCHMKKTGGEGANGHSFHGEKIREEPAAIVSALTVTTSLENESAKIAVANTGAGHDVPTDSRHKAIDLKYRWADEGGAWNEWTRLARFRDPYRNDAYDLEKTTIPSGETRAFSVLLPSEARKIEFVLYYKTNPFQPDAEAAIIFRKLLEIRR